MTLTSVYLLRHAHADWSEDDNRPLSASGAGAAREVARWLSSHPIAAIYSSPSRRSIETVGPLATCLGLQPELVPDLRERLLPVVPNDQFDQTVRAAWQAPSEALPGGESNLEAQTRGLGVLRGVIARHAGSAVLIATHGNLLALIVSGLNPAFGYEFWRCLSFPDVYRLSFEDDELVALQRCWPPRDHSLLLDSDGIGKRS